ncbi:MAG: hypothetical protein R3C49_12440 [Planctomycetaceae bacterium]
MTYLAPLLALGIASSSFLAIAQTKAKSAQKDDAAETSKYRRLPTYYGQLELKDDQKEDIYKIRESFGARIDDLEAQLEELRGQMNKEIEGVLTTTQKSALSKLKAGNKSSSSAKKEDKEDSDEKPKAAPKKKSSTAK